MHFQVHHRVLPEAEVQAGIVAGIETALTHEALGLCFPSIMSENPGSDGASIGLYSLELHFNPILFSLDVIA